ncbi:MAG: biotin/lipoyl-binding protein [Anaerolineae bacterium]|nr:biotin/lipoyl-binding protein [Anaerolineae bacterium]
MKFSYTLGNEVFELDLEASAGGYQARLNGDVQEVQLIKADEAGVEFLVDGKPIQAVWAQDGDQRWISLNGRNYAFEKVAGNSRLAGSGRVDDCHQVRAPMPGQVRQVYVQKGDNVERGQTLLLLEAMKMEMRILAPCDGVVVDVAVSKDNQVEKDNLLVAVE